MVGGRRCPLSAGTRGRNTPAMQRAVIRTLWAEGAECRKAKRLSKFSKWRTERWLAGLESRAERQKENAPSELGGWIRVRPQWLKTEYVVLNLNWVEYVVLNHLIVWVQDILCLKAKLGTLPLMLTLSYLLKPGRYSSLVNDFKLALFAAWEVDESKIWSVEARNTTLFGKPADGEDGRLMSQINHLVGSGCQVFS